MAGALLTLLEYKNNNNKYGTDRSYVRELDGFIGVI